MRYLIIIFLLSSCANTGLTYNKQVESSLVGWQFEGNNNALLKTITSTGDTLKLRYGMRKNEAAFKMGMQVTVKYDSTKCKACDSSRWIRSRIIIKS